jgi:polygalacturonase
MKVSLRLPGLLLVLVGFVLVLLLGCATGQPAGGELEPIARVQAPFPFPSLDRPAIPGRWFDIREYGAMEGGEVKVTASIRKAFEAASRDGGGHILIPPGKWLTGAIHLENNTALYVSRGAELLFSQDPTDYLPPVFSRHEDVECYKYSAFIYADGKENIGIIGGGVLNGQGRPWWDWKTSKADLEKELYAMAERGIPAEKRVFDGTNGRALRPAFFQPMNCRNVLVEGVTFLYGAFWTITPTYCENVIVRRIRIQTEGEYGHTPNGDGVDPSSCKNVLIEYCEFDTGDDCIAIKAGRDADGLRVQRPTENVVIRHCKGLHGHGGVVLGSETSGSIRNVYAYDCEFNGTDRVVRLKSARGRGGVLENMWFRAMRGDKIEKEALHLNLLYTGSRYPEQPVDRTTPIFRNIHFTDVTITNGKGYGIEILGLPEMPVQDVTFDSIRIEGKKGIRAVDARKIRLDAVSISTPSSPVILLEDVEDFSLGRCSVQGERTSVVRIEGARSRDISLPGSLPAASLGKGVASGAVRIRQ